MLGSFVLERLIGGLLFSFFLLLCTELLFQSKNTTQTYKTLNRYLIILVIMAYGFVPSESADLYRWLEIMDSWKSLDIFEFFNNHLLSSSTPLSYFLMYLSSLFDLKGILPAICALIFYNNVFYVAKDMISKKLINSKSLGVSLFFVMSIGSFLEVISGVRNFVAISIVYRSIYDNLFNNSSLKKTIFLFIAASLIHPMAIALSLSWIVFFFFRNEISFNKKYIYSLLFLILAPVMYLLTKNYINDAFNKAVYYLLRTNSYSYLWEYAIGIISVIVVGAYIFFYSTKLKSKTEKDLIKYLKMIFFVTLFLSFEYNLFHRLSTYLVISSFPLISLIFTRVNKKEYYYYLISFSFLLLMLAISRGNLSAYKFFVR